MASAGHNYAKKFTDVAMQFQIGVERKDSVGPVVALPGPDYVFPRDPPCGRYPVLH